MKDIATDDRVGKVIYNFESSAVQSWVSADEARLISLTFPAFLVELKKKFLPRSWEDELVQDQITMQGSTNFLTWVNTVQNANDEPRAAGSAYHIDNNHFRCHLIPRLSNGLKRLYKANNGMAPGATQGTLDAITDLDDWLERIQLLEQDLQATRGAAWVAKATKAGNTPHLVPTATPSASLMPTSSTAPTTVPLSPLTDDEKNLLRLHLGCFKCRIFYAGHLGRNCNNPRPTPEDCRRVTAAYAAKANGAYEKKNNSTTIAAVFTGGATFNDSESEGEGEEWVDANEAEEYVTSPFDLPAHLIWTCCLDTPATCAPTPVNALIDHGSSPVLISRDLAEILCLTPRPLFKPLSVSGAFAKKRKSPEALELTHYCKISIQSPDALWHSRTIDAIICPELYTDLILGLDFLSKNKIVVDADLRTAIAKESGYDLLNPPDPETKKKQVVKSPAEKRKIEARLIKDGQQQTRKLRTLVHMELRALFDENEERFNLEAFTTGPPNVIAAIKVQLKQLAGLATLQKLDLKMKAQFPDRFPTDIPHVTKLPTDVYHRIELLPGAPVSVARAYGCPRKYRAGWKTLLDQHAAAGRIRPSSSPYTSPSFIIPKADPTVLPRWVNDY